MTPNDIMNRIEAILDETAPAVLALASKDGFPHMRWMTPAVLKGQAGVLFAITDRGFAQRLEKEYTPQVEWMIQKHTLAEVISVQGKISVIDNPALRTEVMAKIGDKLRTFWSVNPDATDFVVLETVFTSVSWFNPVKAEREIIQFLEGK